MNLNVTENIETRRILLLVLLHHFVSLRVHPATDAFCKMDSGRYGCSNINIRVLDVIFKSFSIGNAVGYFHSKFQVIMVER